MALVRKNHNNYKSSVVNAFVCYAMQTACSFDQEQSVPDGKLPSRWRANLCLKTLAHGGSQAMGPVPGNLYSGLLSSFMWTSLQYLLFWTSDPHSLRSNVELDDFDFRQRLASHNFSWSRDWRKWPMEYHRTQQQQKKTGRERLSLEHAVWRAKGCASTKGKPQTATTHVATSLESLRNTLFALDRAWKTFFELFSTPLEHRDKCDMCVAGCCRFHF